jgi:hypothetical protein
MRLARILPVVDPSRGDPEPPVLALVRDDVLYRVGPLERFYRTGLSGPASERAEDFHTRVVALGAAGLGDLDERLVSGFRPQEAVVARGAFSWLPPCDPEGAALIHVDTFDVGGGGRGGPGPERPSLRLGWARGLLAHDERVPIPAAAPELRVRLAFMLREDLHRATWAEARDAVLGVSLLFEWSSLTSAPAADGPSVLGQLGPVLTVPRTVPDLAGKRLEVSVAEGAVAEVPLPSPRWSPAEAIAYASQAVELAAGDLVSVGPLPLPLPSPGFDVRVSVTLEGFGTLSGRPVRGPDETAWRG